MKSTPNSQIIEALARISDAVTSNLYLEEILKLMVTVTAEVMHSKICSLMMLDKSTGELVVKATQSVSEFYNRKPNARLGEGIAGRVAQQGKPVTVLDVRKDPRYRNQEIAKQERLCSLLSVPLIFKGDVIGVLNCYTTKPHRFSRSEINIIRSIANQAAVVIENFRLVAECQNAHEELEVAENGRACQRCFDETGEPHGTGSLPTHPEIQYGSPQDYERSFGGDLVE